MRLNTYTVELDSTLIRSDMAHKEIINIAHVHLKDRDCCVSVSLNTLTHALHLFKYSEETGICVYECFEDHSLAQDWLAEPLPKSKPKHY